MSDQDRSVPVGRDYESLARSLSASGDRGSRMAQTVDALWGALEPTGVSWVGFYLKEAGRDEMVLGPRRDKPACSPIGLHGACGLAWRTGEAVVVTDVANLGAGYIACDPRDRSELVLPLFDQDGSCWGVLDADSYDVGAFDERDARSLLDLMEWAGLSSRSAGRVPIRVI